MPRVTAEERALARAAVYRVLGACFSYPDRASVTALAAARPVAQASAAVLGLASAARELERALAEADHAGLEAAYQRAFTLSYSEDCPMYETAFSARHLYQQTRHLADLSAFYRAFGVGANADRPDHIAVELEFCYLLTLKEATARAAGDAERVAICRGAQRSFLRDHLARWAPLFAGRAERAATGTPFAAAARLLAELVAHEERFLRLGTVRRYRREPASPIDEPGDMTCPLAEAAVESLIERLPARGEESDHDPVAVG